MKRVIGILLLCASFAQAQSTPLQTLPAFFTQARSTYVLQLPNPDGDWQFSQVSLYVALPAVGDSTCGVKVFVVDWSAGTFSQATFIGAGGTSTNQPIVFTVPKGHAVAYFVLNVGNCSSFAREVNIAGQYRVL